MKKVDNMTDFIKGMVYGKSVSIGTAELCAIKEKTDFVDSKYDAEQYGKVDWERGKPEEFRGQKIYPYGNFHPNQIDKSLNVGTLIFIIDTKEKDNYNRFVSEHIRACKFMQNPHNAGAVGMNLAFEFRPNSIGQTTKVVCLCGEECDLTDYASF